ncbi:MAG: C1 family peptidase [Bacteriovoracaceae bacterium]
MKKIIIPFVLFNSAFASTLIPVANDYRYQDFPEYQVILATLKSYGDFTLKEKEQILPAKKELSRGEKMVEEAKAKNRAILAQMRNDEKAKEESLSNLSEMDRLKKENEQTLNSWKKEVIETRKMWQKEQEIFLGRLKVYQENTFEIPVKKEKIVEKKIIKESIPEVYIVNSAFDVPIRDQKSRPTCSSFAGVRAMEILLAQNKQLKDLSEQYFYWSSKPNCQSSPCSQKGSWVTPGFKFSQSLPTTDIPFEERCLYQSESIANNETQIPLNLECKNGSVKISKYEEVLTLADVVEKLKKNIPVVMAAKLSKNFYKNQGLVTLKENNQEVTMDSHSLGHAFLAVGLMELPIKLQAEEGLFCIIIANSWGKGWGAGGYSCLTEKWLTKYRQPSPFVSVSEVILK